METKLSKKHQTSENSIQSFIDYNREGFRTSDTVKVFDALKKYQPCTSRQLIKLAGLERTNITRILFDITRAPDPLAKIVYNAPCPVTGRKVSWYSMIEFEVKEQA